MKLGLGFRRFLIVVGICLLGVGFTLILFRTWYIYDIIFYTFLFAAVALYIGLTGKT